MTGTETVVLEVCRSTLYPAPGELAAIVELTSAAVGALVVSFPRPTAEALARRMLTSVTEPLDDSLIQDCVGEMANVVAGQAKAMLADGPYRFDFSVPMAAASRPLPDIPCLVVAFN